MKSAFYNEIWRRKAGRSPGIASMGRAAIALEMMRDRSGNHLDLGCGDGEFLVQSGAGRSTSIGLDLSETAVAAARARGLHADVHDFSSAPLPYPDASFDIITLLDVIEHVFDIRFMLGEIARVLKPGGLCVLTTPNIQWLPRLLAIARGRWPRTSGDPEGFDGGHIHYFTYQSLEYELKKAGICPVERRACQGAEPPIFGQKIVTLLLPRARALELFSPSIIIGATR